MQNSFDLVVGLRLFGAGLQFLAAWLQLLVAGLLRLTSGLLLLAAGLRLLELFVIGTTKSPLRYFDFTEKIFSRPIPETP